MRKRLLEKRTISKFIFVLIGLASTLWFFIRVIPITPRYYPNNW